MAENDSDDLTHEQKIEYEPLDEPDYVTGTTKLYLYDEDRPVPDIIITTSEPDEDEKFDLWGYQGHNGMLVLCVRTAHRHPPDYADEECKKWSVFSEDGFPPLEEAPPTPEEVTELAVEHSDAPVADKSRGGVDEGE